MIVVDDEAVVVAVKFFSLIALDILPARGLFRWWNCLEAFVTSRELDHVFLEFISVLSEDDMLPVGFVL